MMFVPLQTMTAIQVLLWERYYKITTRNQLIKGFMINGWGQESSEYLVDGIRKAYAEDSRFSWIIEALRMSPSPVINELGLGECDIVGQDLCLYYRTNRLQLRGPCKYGSTHGVSRCPYHRLRRIK